VTDNQLKIDYRQRYVVGIDPKQQLK